MNTISYGDIARLFLEKQSFVLTTHVNPDGDGLGCEYALYHFLKREKKDVRIINTSELPENYSFLNTDHIFEKYSQEQHPQDIFNVDAIVIIDMNDAQRLKSLKDSIAQSNAVKMVIDHHLEPKPFADLYCIEENACACGEMLYDIFQTLPDRRLSYEMALGLYIAIMTDTGSFRFSRTTPRVHRITSELLSLGVDPQDVYKKIFDEYSYGRTALLGRILASMEMVCDGRATITHVSRAMFAETGTQETDVENVVNYGLTIRGVDATVLLVELDDGVKISFRSRGEIAINEVAKQFGGGGHKNASGARLFGVRLSDVKAQVIEALEALLKN